MDFGWTSLCLPTKDLDGSRRYYEALGMQVIEEIPGVRVLLRNGPFRIALMTFLTEPLLNWRGGDAFAIHAAVTAACPDAPGAPNSYRADDPEFGADADGACWTTRDPDGHEILFDTNDLESSDDGRAGRIARILLDAEQALERAGADEACLLALREQIIDRFTKPGAGPTV